MVNQIFGLNLAQIVDDAIVGAGGTNTGVLRKFTTGTYTPGNLTGGTNPTSTDYPFRGFLDNRDARRLGASLVSEAGQFVSIFGNSLPAGITPAVSDRVIIENTTFTITEVTNRDPAGALYEVRVSR